MAETCLPSAGSQGLGSRQPGPASPDATVQILQRVLLYKSQRRPGFAGFDHRMPGLGVGVAIFNAPHFDLPQYRKGCPPPIFVRQDHLEKLGPDFVSAARRIDKSARHLAVGTPFQKKILKTSRKVVRDIWRLPVIEKTNAGQQRLAGAENINDRRKQQTLRR